MQMQEAMVSAWVIPVVVVFVGGVLVVVELVIGGLAIMCSQCWYVLVGAWRALMMHVWTCDITMMEDWHKRSEARRTLQYALSTALGSRSAYLWLEYEEIDDHGRFTLMQWMGRCMLFRALMLCLLAIIASEWWYVCSVWHIRPCTPFCAHHKARIDRI